MARSEAQINWFPTDFSRGPNNLRETAVWLTTKVLVDYMNYKWKRKNDEDGLKGAIGLSALPTINAWFVLRMHQSQSTTSARQDPISWDIFDYVGYPKKLIRLRTTLATQN